MSRVESKFPHSFSTTLFSHSILDSNFGRNPLCRTVWGDGSNFIELTYYCKGRYRLVYTLPPEYSNITSTGYVTWLKLENLINK